MKELLGLFTAAFWMFRATQLGDVPMVYWEQLIACLLLSFLLLLDVAIDFSSRLSKGVRHC